jgi:Na+/melibiose symporter-like transporter
MSELNLLCSAIAFECDECWTNEVGDLLLVLLQYILAVSVREHVLLFCRKVLGVNRLTASLIVLVQGLFDVVWEPVLRGVSSQVRKRFYYYPG